jgi:hypothetical protein
LDNHISVSSARDVSQELKLILNVHAWLQTMRHFIMLQ